MKNGAVSLMEFVEDSNEAVVEAIGNYEDWATKITDCNRQLTELQKTIAQLELEKFNNTAQDFDDQYDLRDAAIGNIDKQIALPEEMGELVGALADGDSAGAWTADNDTVFKYVNAA